MVIIRCIVATALLWRLSLAIKRSSEPICIGLDVVAIMYGLVEFFIDMCEVYPGFNAVMTLMFTLIMVFLLKADLDNYIKSRKK